MLLKFIVAIVVFLLILNILAFIRRRVGAIQDEVFQATYHSIEDAHRKGKADLSEEASKIEGFFGEQAYGSSKKIPKSQQDKVKKTVNKLKDKQRNQN